MSRWEWATRVQYADGPPQVTPVRDEETARWTHGLMRTMPFPYVVEGGKTATGVELVVRLRDSNDDWQVTE